MVRCLGNRTSEIVNQDGGNASDVESDFVKFP
jgi:hypothetical protein